MQSHEFFASSKEKNCNPYQIQGVGSGCEYLVNFEDVLLLLFVIGTNDT